MTQSQPIEDVVVAELYRGLFEVEPPADLGGHADWLKGAGLDKLSTLLRSMVRSKHFGNIWERHHASALIENPFTPFLETPIYRHVISLGSNCYTSAMLKRANLKRYSSPFDWIFSNPSMIVYVINDQFKTFLDRNNYLFVPVENRDNRHMNLCEHEFYNRHFGVKFMFNHHNPLIREDYEYFRRCASRFMTVLQSEDEILFVITAPSHIANEAAFYSILECISKFSKKADLMMFAVDAPASEAFGFSVVAQKQTSRLVLYRPLSALGGEQFRSQLDDILVQKFVMRLNFDLIS